MPWNSVTVATAATTATAGSATLSLTGLVHVERSPIEFLAAHSFNGGVALVITSHRHESEAAGAAGVAVSDDGHFLYCAVSGKSISKCVFGRIKI